MKHTRKNKKRRKRENKSYGCCPPGCSGCEKAATRREFRQSCGEAFKSTRGVVVKGREGIENLPQLYLTRDWLQEQYSLTRWPGYFFFEVHDDYTPGIYASWKQEIDDWLVDGSPGPIKDWVEENGIPWAESDGLLWLHGDEYPDFDWDDFDKFYDPRGGEGWLRDRAYAA